MKNLASVTARVFLSISLLLLMAFASACGDDGGDAVADAAVSADAGEPDATTSGAQCFPTGIYGKCMETGCSNCLSGASIYSVCSSSCTEDSDCGAAADFDGASPLCAPLNQGDMVNKICVLTCTSTDQCPCGLECRASGVPNVNICAETL